MALCWLRYESLMIHKKPMQTISSLRSEKRLRVSKSRTARLDGWIIIGRTKRGEQIGYSFEYHGSVVHSNPEIMTKEEFEHGLNPINGRPNKEVYKETLARDEEIRKHLRVAKHFVMWEHVWQKKIKENPFVKTFVKQSMVYLAPKSVEKSFSWQRCLQLISEGKLCGIVKCSLSTPPSKMKEAILYPPFWLHRNLTRADLCENEKKYAEKYDMFKDKKGQRTLCNELSVKDTVISTDLLKFYVDDMGLICTDIDCIIQFRGIGKPWQPMLEKCIDFRVEGRNKGNPVQVNAAKAILNTFFGSSIIRAQGRNRCLYVWDKDATKMIQKDNFLDINPVGPSHNPEAMHETKLSQQIINQKSPKQIGFWILNCSKMILLRFIHLQLQRYLRPGSFEIYATDTDSCVLGVATKGTNLRAICKPELYQEFDEIYPKIFVTRPEDSLVPLLLKLEKEGHVFVGLASKTFQLASNDDPFPKIASKGISRNLENDQVLRLSNYLSTVFDVDDIERHKAVLRGMRVDREKHMRTYVQQKKGLRRFGPKVGYFPVCGICNFPRELKDDHATLLQLYF